MKIFIAETQENVATKTGKQKILVGTVKILSLFTSSIFLTFVSTVVIYPVRTGSELLYRGVPFPMAVFYKKKWIYDKPINCIVNICFWILAVMIIYKITRGLINFIVRGRCVVTSDN